MLSYVSVLIACLCVDDAGGEGGAQKSEGSRFAPPASSKGLPLHLSLPLTLTLPLPLASLLRFALFVLRFSLAQVARAHTHTHTHTLRRLMERINDQSHGHEERVCVWPRPVSKCPECEKQARTRPHLFSTPLRSLSHLSSFSPRSLFLTLVLPVHTRLSIFEDSKVCLANEFSTK